MTRRLLVVLALVGIVASGCSLGPREEWAKTMRDAGETAMKAGAAKVHVTVTMKVIKTVIRQVPTPLFTSMDGIVNFKDRTNEVFAKGLATPKGSNVYFDDLVTYVPRSAGSIADHDAKLHWARYDFKNKPTPDKIDATDKYAALGYAIAPTLAVELLQGVLAGSLKTVDTATMDGENVTEYSGKLAPDAATRDLRSQPRVDGITRMFKIIGQTQDLFAFRVWMDEKGLAKRIQFILKQQEDIVDQFRTTVDYTFTDFGPATAIAVPARSDCLGHRRFVDFAGEYTRASV
jgi:hypothetical protein